MSFSFGHSIYPVDAVWQSFRSPDISTRHRSEFARPHQRGGWTSLKEVELSSRFSLVFLEFGTFLQRAQPKLCFLGLKTRAALVD